MSVSLTGGLPVLLQAISSLTSADAHSETAKVKQGRATKVRNEQAAMESPQAGSKVVGHLLQGMNEAVSDLLPSSASSPKTVESAKDISSASKPEVVELNATIQQQLAAQLAARQGKVATASSFNTISIPSSGDVSMVNVLTALASQHVKTSVKQEDTDSFPITISTPSHISTSASVANVVVPSAGGGSQDAPQPQIIIYYNNAESAPSQSSAVMETVSDSRVQGSVQNYRLVMRNGDVSAATVTTLSEPVAATVGEATSAPSATAGIVMGELENMSGTFVVGDSKPADGADSVCPVCGDKISGYHYGVYTCESCKGFFKRTVQNKKTFVCHRQADCEINILNRKKCPACRFSKCINVGMKLEAIRHDRTRGGRSSYDGSSPQVKQRPNPTPRKVKRPVSEMEEEEERRVEGLPGLEMLGAAEGERTAGLLGGHGNHSSVVSQQSEESQGLNIPELLTDIMNMEALLVDDDLPPDAEGEGQDEGGGIEVQGFYHYLMQLTELRLYKLVRWARNLPQFGAISTDDQIILLQNCWSDLLALGVCWRSMESPDVLNISATRSVSLEQAETLGFGDVADRLLSITRSLQSLGVDQYEYVALKVLLLISPDVKGLREPSRVQDHQEKLAEALLDYTASHYPSLPAKFGEMLLRLPELARISFLAKENLLLVLPPDMASCGLLVELLKGENAVKD